MKYLGAQILLKFYSTFFLIPKELFCFKVLGPCPLLSIWDYMFWDSCEENVWYVLLLYIHYSQVAEVTKFN